MDGPRLWLAKLFEKMFIFKGLKGVISKFWNFLYYWSDLTEIFTQYVKSENKHFLFLNIFPFRAWFFIYIQIYI